MGGLLNKKSYFSIYRILYGLIISYAVFGRFDFLALSPYFPELKLYPLWKNDLFAFSPKKFKDYQILIHKIDHLVYEDPQDFFKLIPTIEGKTFSPSLLITNLGDSLNRGLTKEFSILQKTFHILLFRKYNFVEYSIHHVEWSPLERYQKQIFRKRTELGKFTFSKF